MTLKDIKWTFNTPNFFFLIFKLPVLPLLYRCCDISFEYLQFVHIKLTFYALLSHMCIYIPEGATCFCHFIRFPFLIFWMYIQDIFFENMVKFEICWFKIMDTKGNCKIWIEFKTIISTHMKFQMRYNISYFSIYYHYLAW